MSDNPISKIAVIINDSTSGSLSNDAFASLDSLEGEGYEVRIVGRDPGEYCRSNYLYYSWANTSQAIESLKQKLDDNDLFVIHVGDEDFASEADRFSCTDNNPTNSFLAELLGLQHYGQRSIIADSSCYKEYSDQINSKTQFFTTPSENKRHYGFFSYYFWNSKDDENGNGEISLDERYSWASKELDDLKKYQEALKNRALSDKAKLVEIMRELVPAGVDFKFAREVALTGIDDASNQETQRVFSYFFSHEIYQKVFVEKGFVLKPTSKGIFRLDNPLPHMEIGRQGFQILEIDSAMHGLKNEITFSPYVLYVHADHGITHLSLWNLLKDEPIYEISNTFLGIEKTELENFSQALQADLDTIDISRFIDSLPPLTQEEITKLNAQKIITPGLPSTWTEEEGLQAKKSWQFLSKHFDVYLQVRPPTTDLDRLASLFTLFHNPEEMYFHVNSQNQNYPFTNQGVVDSISLDFKKPIRSGRLERIYKKHGTEGYIQDKYGNHIYPLSYEKLTGRMIYTGLAILPPRALNDINSSQKLANIGMDLSLFGLEDHPYFLTQASFDPAILPNVEFPYILYDQVFLGHDEVQALYNTVSEQALWAEKYFGLSAGETIKGFTLLPSAAKNASVAFNKPDIINIQDEMVKGIMDGDINIIPHESYHIFDFAFGFSQHPDFVKLYTTLVDHYDRINHIERFFNTMDESSFLGGTGGHSSDNAKEFFATLVNTLNAPEWQKKIEEMEHTNRELYYHSLKTLKKVFDETKPDLVNTPVYHKLLERIDSLEQIEEMEPLEAVTRNHLSYHLSQEPNAIPVLTLKEFEKVLKKEKDPIIVVAYQTEENLELFEEIKILGQDFKKYGEVVAINIAHNSELYKSMGIDIKWNYHPTLFVFKDGHVVYTPTPLYPEASFTTLTLEPLKKREKDPRDQQDHDRLIQEVYKTLEEIKSDNYQP